MSWPICIHVHVGWSFTRIFLCDHECRASATDYKLRLVQVPAGSAPALQPHHVQCTCKCIIAFTTTGEILAKHWQYIYFSDSGEMHDSPTIPCSRHCSRQWICTTVVRELLGVCVVNNPPYLDIVHIHFCIYIVIVCIRRQTRTANKALAALGTQTCTFQRSKSGALIIL